MVRCCRTPAIARELFSANALAGWPSSSIAYTPRQLRKRKIAARRRRLEQVADEPIERVVMRLDIGRKLH